MDKKISALLSRIYKNKRVLITGDTGFKGSWLAFWLTMLGAKVSGYALPPKGKDSHFTLLALNRLIRHVDGDIRDLAAFKKAVNKDNPEILFHLAAQPLVRSSYDDPKTTFDTNVGGSVNILEAVRHSRSIRSVVYITSDKCYRNKEWMWGYRENDELGGVDPYSASKAAAELVFRSYLESYFTDHFPLGIASARAGNVIGGGDWSDDRIVPDCIRSLHASRRIVLRNPHSTRPWQHVLEPLGGYLLLGARLYETPLKYKGSWNFGPNEGAMHTVEDLTKKLIALWGSGTYSVHSDKKKLHEAGLLHLNCDKAHQLLHWHPLWDFNTTAEMTASWYKKVFSGQLAREVTAAQIRSYMEGSHD